MARFDSVAGVSGSQASTAIKDGGGSSNSSSGSSPTREYGEYSYVYDPATGTWVPSAPSVGTPPSSSSQDPEKVPSSATGNDSSSQVDSKGESDKEYIEIEFNTLTGELVVLPSKKTIRIKVNDTIEVLGVGSNLSGKYFVSAVKRTLSADSGYSQTLTVLKNGFGDSLKKKGGSSTEVSTDTTNRGTVVEKSTPTFKVGDTVKIVGDAIYSTGEKVPEWVKKKSLTIRQISEDGTRVLLMPIIYWTYTRYIQKE